MKFVIFAPSFDQNSGGNIALYKLARLLKQVGQEVSILNWGEPSEFSFLRIFKDRIKRLLFGAQLSPYFSLPKTDYDALQDAVVIYPEVISGNPLRAQKVVRWLLYKPGYFTGEIDYSKTDLFFYYLKEYDYPEMNKFPDNQLYVADFFLDIYKQTNFGEREGSCYMVRKGKDRVLNMHPKDAVQVDGLSHRKLAEAFNKYEYFFSYDLYTMYTVYASICGCKAVVLPPPGLSAEQWIKNEEGRNGVAFGLDDVGRAEKTRSKLVEGIKANERNNIKAVKAFVLKCQNYFEGGA